MSNPLDAIVIGAGPAGLATSRELTRAGIAHTVLERGDRLGYTWHNLYDSLVLHTGKHMSALPGMPFSKSTSLFPTRREFLDYLEAYAAKFALPVETRADVASVERTSDRWRVRTGSDRIFESRALVVATGIVANPSVPAIAGRDLFKGRVFHSVDYRRPDDLAGQRVLVVGAGNSAGEISVELLRHGAKVAVAVQSGAYVVPRELLGIPIQYVSVLLNPLPRAALERIVSAIGALRGPRVLPPPRNAGCPKVPLIGLALADAVRAGTIQLRGGLDTFTNGGVRFADGVEEPFDTVILATGYRPALRFLDGLVRTDTCGLPDRRDGAISLDQQDLYFVGYTFDTRGAIYNMARDARRAAREIVVKLRASHDRRPVEESA